LGAHHRIPQELLIALEMLLIVCLALLDGVEKELLTSLSVVEGNRLKVVAETFLKGGSATSFFECHGHF